MKKNNLTKAQQLLKDGKEKMMASLAMKALRLSGGNRKKAAKKMGYEEDSRMSLYRIMKRNPEITKEFPLNPPRHINKYSFESKRMRVRFDKGYVGPNKGKS